MQVWYLKKITIFDQYLTYLGNDTRQGHSSHGRHLVCDLSNGAISNDFGWLLTKISRSRHYLTLNLRNGTRQRHSYNGILIEILKGGIRMTLSHLKWLSEICNDTEHARSLCDSWATCHHLIWVRPQPFQCTTGTIPPLFLHGVGHFPLPPPPSANRQSTISTVNVYKIDSGYGQEYGLM